MRFRAHTICVYDKFGLRALFVLTIMASMQVSLRICVCVFIQFLYFMHLLLFETICHRSHLLFIIIFIVGSRFVSFASFVPFKREGYGTISVFFLSFEIRTKSEVVQKGIFILFCSIEIDLMFK